MPTGLLEVIGSIDLAQFWPTGTSDADTTKLHINVSANAFRFRPTPTAPFQVTHVFDNAIIDGTGDRPAIDKQQRVTVRLQGIDAPELHYRPAAAIKPKERTDQQHKLYLEWNLEYRQYLSETATVALSTFLTQFGHQPLPCRVLSAVDTPDEVFDTYARLVGDVVIDAPPAVINVNQWLVAQGHAMPAFYASMNEPEITELTTLYLQAKRSPLWAQYYSPKLTRFDWDLVFRGNGAPVLAATDTGRVILPKLFRRQSTYQVNRRAKMITGSFPAYLRQRRDEWHRVQEFLIQGPAAAPIYTWRDLFVANKLAVGPEQIVFREKPSRIRRSRGTTIAW